MSTVSNWMHVDLFTVDQAAALWCGFDPASVSPVASWNPPEILAAKQMLSAAIVDGQIRADSSKNMMSTIGNYSNSLVRRSDLEEFARKRQLFPTFLFDTMAPFVRVDAKRSSGEPPIAMTAPALPPTVNRGGRPQEHDWDSFTMEIIQRANMPDGLPEKQADLVRDMLAWFQRIHGREPAESAIKDRISKIYRYLREAKNPIK